MDDDCQRGMFRAYHVITSLIRYQASTFNNKSMKYDKIYNRSTVEPLDDIIGTDQSVPIKEVHVSD